MLSTGIAQAPAPSGLEPFDPGRHMREVAGLVGSVFAQELDERGRGALREMETLGRVSPYLGSALGAALWGDYGGGFVWIEDGAVVGNVTLQMADTVGARWRISNVAVAPTYRRRGIARALMQESLVEVARRGGTWALLQVRTDNPGARRLYQDMGFTDVCRDAIWRLERNPERAPDAPEGEGAERYRSRTGTELIDLAHASRSAMAHWAEPLEPDRLRLGPLKLFGERLGRLTGLAYVERWAVWGKSRLAAAVEARGAGPVAAEHSMRLWVRPEAAGEPERALIAAALGGLAELPPRPVVAQPAASTPAMEGALRDAGFAISRDLTTMRRPITGREARNS